MNNNQYIKKLIIGTTFGAVALFGAAVTASAQQDTSTAKGPIPLVSDGKPLDADAARSSVSVGYVEGYKRGQAAGKKKSKYDAKSWMPYRDALLFDAPIIPSNKYRPFYDEGYTRGYEDGYNNTTKYGSVSEEGGQKQYTVNQSVMDSIVDPSKTGI